MFYSFRQKITFNNTIDYTFANEMDEDNNILLTGILQENDSEYEIHDDNNGGGSSVSENVSSVVKNDNSNATSGDKGSECDIMDCAFDGQVTSPSVDESNQEEGTGTAPNTKADDIENLYLGEG